MTLLGTIGMLGMGTLLIGELPRRSDRAGLVSAALLTCGLGSLVLGLGFAVLGPRFSARFDHISGTPGQAALFMAGVILTGVSLVFDQATIGLMRGGLQLTRNAIFVAVKLLVLPAAAIVLHDQFGVGVTASWIVGIALSMMLLAIRLRLSGIRVLPRPDWGVLRGLGRTALAHNWLNLSLSIPMSLIPVLVTVIVSPSANAAFYAAWTLVFFLKVVPIHLSTVLFAVAAADPQVIARKLRFTLRLSLLIGLPGMAVLGIGAHLALSMFGPGYARAATLPLRAAGHQLPAFHPQDAVHRGVPCCRPDTARSRSHDSGCSGRSDRLGGWGSIRRTKGTVSRAARRVHHRGTGDYRPGDPRSYGPRATPAS